MKKIKKPEKTQVIAVANSKGGSGKSTTVSMLSIALGARGYRCLVIDCDSQMDLTNTMGFTVDESLVEFGLQLIDFNKTIYQALRQKKDLQDFIIQTRYDNVDLIAGDDYISRIEYDLHHEYQREFILRRAMQDLLQSRSYDFILFDTSTHLGDMAGNILNTSDSIIIPVPMAMFGIRGIRTFVDFYNQFGDMNPSLHILGILTTLYKVSNKIINTRGESLLKNTFGEAMMFDTKIPIDTTIEKAQWNNIAALEYAPGSKAAVAYQEFAQEVIRRVCP